MNFVTLKIGKIVARKKTIFNKKLYMKEYREFNKEKIAKQDKEYRIKNKERTIENHKRYYEKNKEIMKNRHIKYTKEQIKNIRLKTQYGITIEQYNQMFLEQNGNCAICNINQSNFKRGLAVDHCHITGKIRGLLCGNCNLGIGNFKEGIENLYKAIEYIKKHK